MGVMCVYGVYISLTPCPDSTGSFGIAPWNAPFTLTIRAFAVPLICGNTVIVKSSEFSPRTQALAVRLFHEAGFPSGVLNDTRERLTAEIIAHLLVSMPHNCSEAAKHIKPTVLELGGKAPAVICVSTERVIVQRGAADALIAQIKSLYEGLTVGAPATAKLGSLFAEGSAADVLAGAQAAGAEVLMGDLARDGALVRPHLISGVKPGMRLWERESFGPVIAFALVDTPEEAVELANASDYTLSAALWTSDMYMAQRIAPLIRAGYVNVNGYLPRRAVREPRGPRRPVRLDDFTDKRVLATYPLGRQFPFLQ
ncbi:Aldehyde/histidinol dehydrogenase [Mycena maculata]|uniref:Aldehyde/histidinol dehydrogenase n=1 Tax=Mycena maculata TaxID=230809 RepID=A0AAD7I0B9_9AGAR|nr:Aldehyde/histidinol dehydrogenase [Mycena maculata]